MWDEMVMMIALIIATVLFAVVMFALCNAESFGKAIDEPSLKYCARIWMMGGREFVGFGDTGEDAYEQARVMYRRHGYLDEHIRATKVTDDQVEYTCCA